MIPSEVQPLVGTFLDRELFNVAGLVEQGFTDDAVNGIPVILQRTPHRMSKLSAPATPGFAAERQLTSIDSVAGSIGQDDAEAFGELLGTVTPRASSPGWSGRPSWTVLT